VRLWGDSPAVRERLIALDAAQAQLVLCCEFIPHSLDRWLEDHARSGTIEDIIDRVEQQLFAGVASLWRADVVHFDLHFANILTDGERTQFTDFGLACSTIFELAPDEAAFLSLNASHDICYVVTHLVNWLVTTHLGLTARSDRVDYIERCSASSTATNLPANAARIVARYAPIAAGLNAFYGQLAQRNPGTPYPAARLLAACAAAGLEAPP